MEYKKEPRFEIHELIYEPLSNNLALKHWAYGYS